MAKFLRFIGFMVLALALWQTVSDTFANKAASGGNVVWEYYCRTWADWCLYCDASIALSAGCRAGGHGWTITFADVLPYTAHFYHGIYIFFKGLDWQTGPASGCFVSASWETLWCHCLLSLPAGVRILHFHTKAYSHLVFYWIFLFPLCMVRLCVFAGKYCIFYF